MVFPYHPRMSGTRGADGERKVAERLRPGPRTEIVQLDAISDRFVETIRQRLAENKRIRRALPVWGRLHIDRQLPFLCLYRRPPDGGDAGTDRLVTSEAAYLTASGSKHLHGGLVTLIESVVRTMVEQFGAFLLLELWAASEDGAEAGKPLGPRAPRFRIIAPDDDQPHVFLQTLETALSRIRTGKKAAEVEVVESTRCGPPELAPVMSPTAARKLGCHVAGLEVLPVYRDPGNGTVYPLVLRELRRNLTRALRKSFYTFSCTRTTQTPGHYHVLGRRAMVKAVWEVDRRLAEVSDDFDLLLQVTPVNAESAWRRFRKNRFEIAPVFHYRPLPVDPAILKRRLFDTPVERIEDPALWQLFREKQEELDRRITMLQDLNTPRFVHSSVQLFGDVDDGLLRFAHELLDRLPPRARDDSRGGFLDAAAFSRRAEEEIDRYRDAWSGFEGGVQVRDDIASGLMVSRGSLLVSLGVRIPKARAEALLQHEVGTHMVTFYNGRAQPLKQLYSGLAGYEPLQEGLAVLAEYLAGGLSRPRLRLLAARVLAARLLLDGASFVETFRKLVRDRNFPRRTAFTTTMRVYRGGGLTKDAVYLRGLIQVLDYLAQGGTLQPLLVGKIAVTHVPIIRELQWRLVLEQAPLQPRFLDLPGSAERLARVRSGLTLLQLIERSRGA
jgi:uncharacterized protein (TIGR02421 family)